MMSHSDEDRNPLRALTTDGISQEAQEPSAPAVVTEVSISEAKDMYVEAPKHPMPSPTELHQQIYRERRDFL